MKRKLSYILLGAAAFGLFGCGSATQSETSSVDASSLEALKAEFLSPPNDSRPRTWFHVMSGNMSKPGLTQDFDAMAQGGIGGVLFFNISQFTPIGRVKFGSDEHFDLVSHAAVQAERLDMSFGVHNSDGWTSSGGPWITPDMSMKEVIWSDLQTPGGEIDTILPDLPSRFDYAEDIAVLAYPTLESELNSASFKLSSNWSGFDPTPLQSVKLDDLSSLPFDENNPHYIEFAYDSPVTLKGLTAAHEGPWRRHLTLQASVDGENFKEVMQLPRRRLGQDKSGYEAQFDNLKGKAFRIYANGDIALSELRPTSVSLFSERLARTSLHRSDIRELEPLNPSAPNDIIAENSIKDVSNFVDTNGRLKAQLPEGNWTVLRIGYTSTGAINHPASKEGTGLEVDKFARAPVKVHYDAYLGKIVKRLKSAAPTMHQYTLIDSYEVGGQNWTAGYEDLYADTYGEDLRNFLPILTGRVVEGAKETSIALRRMRALNSNLFQNNYVGYFKALANDDGLDLYIEPYGFGPFNEIDSGTAADIPMGEFWLDDRSTKVAAAVSSAHITGQPIVSAEAFTSRPNINWKFHPGMAKSMGDEAWALGVNEFMFHRFAHQPNDNVRPGMVMSFFGAHIDRTQLWWPMAMKPWTDYISRGQTLLRQGLPVVPIAVYMSDDAPTNCPERGQLPGGLAKDYAFDCLSSAALHSANISNTDHLELSSGMKYRLLHLVDSRCLSLKTLKTLNRLSESGIRLIAEKPKPCDIADGDLDVREALVSEIWNRSTVSELATWEEVLASLDIKPSVVSLSGAPLIFTHRNDKDREIFFIANPSQKGHTLKYSIAAASGVPSIWDPMTGDITKILNFHRRDGRTILPLTLKPEAGLFIVFDKKNDMPREVSEDIGDPDSPIFLSSNGQAYQDTAQATSMVLSAPWTVKLDAEYGSYQELIVSELSDLKDHSDEDVRHYSGPLYYRTLFDIDELSQEGEHSYRLDLGEVAVSAKITLNGEEIGVDWHASQDFDITERLKTKGNVLEIEVATTWVNRLIGDAALPRTDNYQRGKKVVTRRMPDWFANNQAPPEGPRSTFSTIDFYKASDPLVPSGLIGPVTISKFRRSCWAPNTSRRVKCESK